MTAPATTLTVKLVRSTIGRPADQVNTVRALGLKRIGDTKELTDTAAVRGMVNKVKHLLEVSS